MHRTDWAGDLGWQAPGGRVSARIVSSQVPGLLDETGMRCFTSIKAKKPSDGNRTQPQFSWTIPVVALSVKHLSSFGSGLPLPSLHCSHHLSLSRLESQYLLDVLIQNISLQIQQKLLSSSSYCFQLSLNTIPSIGSISLIL